MFVSLALVSVSCADSKTFTDKSGNQFTADPYGWANQEANKIDTVVYEVSAGNIVWSIVLVETIFAPVYFTGWKLYEPVRLKTTDEYLGVRPSGHN